MNHVEGVDARFDNATALAGQRRAIRSGRFGRNEFRADVDSLNIVVQFNIRCVAGKGL